MAFDDLRRFDRDGDFMIDPNQEPDLVSKHISRKKCVVRGYGPEGEIWFELVRYSPRTAAAAVEKARIKYPTLMYYINRRFIRTDAERRHYQRYLLARRRAIVECQRLGITNGIPVAMIDRFRGKGE